MNNVRGLFVSILNACLLVVFVFFAGDKLCLLHKAWTTQSHRIADEAWLRKQCGDPTFFANMKSHTSICEEVENTARVGALWYALEEVSNSLPIGRAWGELKAVSWPALLATGLVLVFFPSLIVSLARYASMPGPGQLPIHHTYAHAYAQPAPQYPPLKSV